MSYCENCRFPLPEGAEYCPNCGTRVKKPPTPPQFLGISLGKIIQAGVLGALISVMISSLQPPDIRLYFIPSFVSSVLVVFLFKARRLEEAVALAFSVYLFADAIVNGIILGSLYFQDIPLSEVYRGYELTFLDVVTYIFNPVSALIAAYLGNRLIAGGRPEQEQPERIDYGFKEEKGPGGVIYETRTDPRPHKV